MFYWPHLELTDYEKRFVSEYKEIVPVLDAAGKPVIDPTTGKPKTWAKPGVLGRRYKTQLNNVANPNVPSLTQVKLDGSIQIARRSRVFGLTFAGDVHAWRLNIYTASGEQFTPRLAGGTFPMVSAMVPGTSWNATATDMSGPSVLTFPAVPDNIEAGQIANISLPMLIEPNWELVPNETLFFQGVPMVETAIILEIVAHVWEFPGMIVGAAGPDKSQAPRMGGGISC